MDYEKLVEQIVHEVYKKLGTEDKIDFSVTKKTAVILWDNQKENYSILEEKFNIATYDENVKEFDTVIISKLCLRGLTTLAMGTNGSQEERFILTSLLKGKEVYILDSGIEYKKYKTTAPKNLYRQYMEYEEKIKGYGVKNISDLREILIDAENDLNNNEDKRITGQLEAGAIGAIDLTDKKLITESDLNKLYIQGTTTIILNKKAMITPLAEDFIRTHHFTIQ